MTAFELSNFSYVVEGRVAGSACPNGNPDDVAECLARHKFRTVVTLTEVPLAAAEALEKRGIRAVHIAVEDRKAPSMDQMDAVAALVRDEANCPVLMHCQAGIGRTGTMLAVALAALEGGTTESITARLRQTRRGALEVKLQEAAFDQWNQAFRSHHHQQQPSSSS